MSAEDNKVTKDQKADDGSDTTDQSQQSDKKPVQSGQEQRRSPYDKKKYITK